uniref:Uncharacterized protein n=1 Tax=Anopheles atroparvus TaxID=41427 RepID=A0AAG5CMX3_ANOAO
MVSCQGRMLLLALVALSLVVDRAPVLAFDDLFDDILSYFYDSESESDSVEVISAGNKNVSIIVKCENCTVSLACDKCANMTTAPMGMMEATQPPPITSTSVTTTTTASSTTPTTMDTPNPSAPAGMDGGAVDQPAADAPPPDAMNGTSATDPSPPDSSASNPDSNAGNENTAMPPP